jgi:hypothetical protein
VTEALRIALIDFLATRGIKALDVGAVYPDADHDEPPRVDIDYTTTEKLFGWVELDRTDFVTLLEFLVART